MEPRTPICQTRIKDDAGVEHEYVMARFGAVAGLRFGSELLGLLGETLHFEGGQVGPALSGLAKGIILRGNDKFITSLFEHVKRDGKSVGDQAGFEQAYTGNLGEVLRCIDWVLVENFAGFSSAALDVIGGRLGSLMTTLAAESDESSMRQWLITAFGLSSAPASAPGQNSATRGPSTSSSKRSSTSKTGRR